MGIRLSYILLSEKCLQAYAELIRDCNYSNRGRYNMKYWLYIGRTGLEHIIFIFAKQYLKLDLNYIMILIMMITE
jgi:hypothetical protein